MTHHLAQINVAKMLAPLNAPELIDFARNLDPINALADGSPGFVWRLVGEGNDATSLRVFEDDLMLVNLSVWTSLEALRAYVYRSQHTEMLRRRREWFARMQTVHTALWWLPAGQLPSVADAKARLDHLQEHGPSRQAFSVQHPFPAPS